jgi:hypothetical protein
MADAVFGTETCKDSVAMDVVMFMALDSSGAGLGRYGVAMGEGIDKVGTE